MGTSAIILISSAVIIITATIIIIYRLMKTGDYYTKVEEALKAGLFEKAAALCLKRIDTQPQDFVLKYYLGEAYEGLKDYTKAILYYEKASITASASDDQEIKTQMFMKTADLYKRMLKPQAALGYYALVLDREPLNIKALFSASEILFELKNYSRAKTYLENLIDAKPDYLKGRFILAKIYINLHQYPEAAAHLDNIVNNKMVEHDVLKTTSTLLLADVLVNMKSFQKAIDLLTPLLNDETYYEEVLTKIIETMLQFNQTNDAIQLIHQHMDKVHSDKKAELTYFLGNAHFKNHNYYDAITAWEAAYKLNNNFRDISRLHNEYFLISNNPVMELIYSTEPSKTEIIIGKLVYPYSISKISKKPQYWAFKAGDYAYVLYRVPLPVPPAEISEMLSVVDLELHIQNSFTLYSLYGVVQGSINMEDKKIILFSQQDLIKLVKEKNLVS